MIRTADAAGADGVVLAGHSVDAYNPKTVRASVGQPLPPARGVAETRRRWSPAGPRAAGLTVLAADGAGEVDLFDADDLLRGPTAWLFGNEAWGLPDELAAPPTTGSPSRSTAAPRASTSPPPPRSASTPRRRVRALEARLGWRRALPPVSSRSDRSRAGCASWPTPPRRHPRRHRRTAW